MTRIFFNQSEEVVDYLSIKYPHFNYKHLPREDVVNSRIIQNSIKIIIDCMKQDLMVFTPNDHVFCKEYLCSCNLCLQFKFKECFEENATLYSDIPCDDGFGDFNDDDDDDDEADRIGQIFNFVDAPSFISFISSSPNEPLYFVKVTEKGTASEGHSNPYGHFISAGEKFLEGFYLKLVRSRNARKKKYQLLPTERVFCPDEVFDTYVEFSEGSHINTNTYNILI